MTCTKLLEKIPDSSYDLDGDGYVGGRDCVLIKRFDVDGRRKIKRIRKKKRFRSNKKRC